MDDYTIRELNLLIDKEMENKISAYELKRLNYLLDRYNEQEALEYNSNFKGQLGAYVN